MPSRLQISLFLLRLGMFAVMAVWTIDKFVNPDHATRVWEKFYLIGGLGDAVISTIGLAQAVVVILFGLGLFKRFSYGLVLIMHAVSTFSSYQQYMSPYEGANILFFAAWPMLAACVALYLLRDEDRILTLRLFR